MKIDWNEQWKTMMSDSMNNRGDSAAISCPRYWDTPERARDYLKNYGCDSDINKNREKLIQELHLKPDSQVLEIGPGPGVLTIPMARMAGQVTVVEPSAGMATVLHERIESENIQNISLIQKRWEDVNPDDFDNKFDLVLASYSLGMHDIKAAIEKMNSICQEKVVLFWHADIPQFELLYSMVWPDLFGREYISGPKSDVLFNVLYEMGIYPSVEYHEFIQKQTFSSIQALEDYFRYQHYLELDSSVSGFQKYFEKFIQEENGVFTHYERLPGMKFQWKAENN
ncbi:class I SAM-dependent methyltransferase [Methanospirillum stamsii]|uniref:Class I SAM-dependent methyltransferase n=2 Tax=Methanospirillum stamsii TaxID=1277351 RepID=A0A2V2N2T4_9EURY|nr:class I SAM-dependent methyltransferase [Methanospirillum stamsii]